jgi:hypothetical protein
MDNNSTKPKPWQATENDITQDDLEDVRKILVKSALSYNQTHAGYIIAIALGFFALVSNFEPFFKSPERISLFIVLMVGLIMVAVYLVLRAIYWSTFESYLMCLNLNQVIALFNKNNSEVKYPFFDRAPNMAILQRATWQVIKDDKFMPWYKKLAFKTA